MWDAIGILGFIAVPVFLILGIVGVFKKNGRVKKMFIWMGACFVIGVIGAINGTPPKEAVLTDTPTNTNSIVAEKPKTEEEKKKETADEKARIEAEKKAEARRIADEKARTEKEAKEAAEAKIKAAKEAKAEEARAKALCKTIPYSKLARDPDKYFATRVVYKGKVIQVMEQGDVVALRVNVTKGSYGIWDDTVLVIYERKAGQSRILEDDIIKFWGSSQGLDSYTTVLGAEMTIPKIEATYLNIIGNQK